jgi:hypothetical protein
MGRSPLKPHICSRMTYGAVRCAGVIIQGRFYAFRERSGACNFAKGMHAGVREGARYTAVPFLAEHGADYDRSN